MVCPFLESIHAHSVFLFPLSEYMFSLLSNLYHTVDSDNYSRRSKNRDINKHVSPYVCFVSKDFISAIFFLNSTLRVREV